MEFLEVPETFFDSIDQLEDLETVAHLSKKRKAKKAARKTRKIARKPKRTTKKPVKRSQPLPVQDTTGTGTEETESFPRGSGGLNPEGDTPPMAVSNEPSETDTGMEDMPPPDEGITEELPEMSEYDHLNLKKAAGKIKAKAKKVVKKIGSVAGSAALLPLLPLKGVMMAALKAKKLPTKGSFKDVVNRFYNGVVKKTNAGKNYDNIDLNNYSDANSADAIGLVVSAIIDFVKQTKAKKAAGKKLSKEEEAIATGAEKITKKLEEKAKGAAAAEVGEKILFDKKTQIVIAGVVVVIIIIVVLVLRGLKKA